MRSVKGSDVVENMSCHPEAPAEHAFFAASASLPCMDETVSARTKVAGSAFHTFTRPNKERLSRLSCVPSQRSTNCSVCLRLAALVSCLCKAELGALGNKASKSACARPLHIFQNTPSMPMSRRSLSWAKLNVRQAVPSSCSNASESKIWAKSKCASFAVEAWYIAPSHHST